MTRNDTNEVGQAVFGYSNGHRLLSSTSTLSAVDVYELAAASDLAPGAAISGGSSYLTGLYLPDSKIYALIRTWLAPEMPRPGCVWSHVLLLDHVLLSTQIDLWAVAQLHRRPNGRDEDPYFSKAFTVDKRVKTVQADADETRKILLAIYSAAPLRDDVENRNKRERAIVAAWSQQWPRLRRQLVFRSIPTSSSSDGQYLRYASDAKTLRGASSIPWLDDAATDATSSDVTPLRRCLWRYGKDVNSGRSALPYLVGLYKDTRSVRLSYIQADGVFARFPPGEASTLKIDILGLAASKLAQIPALTHVDVLRLMVNHPEVAGLHHEAEFARHFSSTRSTDIVGVAQLLTDGLNGVGGLAEAIFDSILPLLSSSDLADPNMPETFVRNALKARIDLLAPAVIDRLPDPDLIAAMDWAPSPEQRLEILHAFLQREASDAVAKVIFALPVQALKVAVDLFSQAMLHESWIQVFRGKVTELVEAVAHLDKADSLVPAAAMLGSPIEPPTQADAWFAAFLSHRQNLSPDHRTRLAVYLLVLSIARGIGNSREIVTEVVPDLRLRVLRNELAAESSEMLSRYLPRDDDYWDLHKRLLKLFRKAYRSGIEFDELLGTIGLDDAQYAYATDQDPQATVRRLWRAVTPWSR